MGIIAAGQITVVDLSDAPVLNTFITASRPTTQTYSKDSRTYNPSYASTPQVLTLKVTKGGSTANIIDSISSLHWFVVDGPIKTEITSKDNSANEYISGAHNEILTTKLDINLNKGSKRYEVMGIWPDPSTGLDVQFGGYIDLLLTQNGATGPQGPQGDTGNGIANTVITYGLSMSDTTEPATWSSERPALVKGMYLWTRTVIIYTNGRSTTSYQISYIAKDADATAEIDKTKQELLEKLETVRDESLAAVDEAKQQLVTVRDESLAAAEEAKQGLTNVNTKVDNAKSEIDKAKQDLANVASELNTAKQDLTDSVTAVNNKVDNAKAELTQAKQQLTTVADDLSTAKQDFQNAVSAVDTKATNLKSDLAQAKQDLASQAQQLQEQASAQSELTNRVSSVEETANGTKTTVSELSKTVAQNGKDITSVTARTKVVEDDLAGTKTTLSQVKTTADSTSQKTATLETGLNGLSARFNSLSVGNKNYLPASRVVNRGCSDFSYSNTTKSWTMTAPASSSTFGNGITFNTKGLNILLNGGETLFFGLMIKANKACSFNYDVNNALSDTTSNDNDDTSKRAHSPSNKSIPANVWTKVWFSYTAKANVAITENNSKFGIVNNTEPVTIEIKEVMVAKSNVPVDYQMPDAELEQKVADYKQTADQNYASLQTTVQNLDGTVQHNKTVADQTAQGFTTRIESLETYKNGESERANAYFESAKTETAKQLTAERTAIAKDYVAKSTYTSDVTGIRNDLTATTTTANTTKTNLANYQASNDRAVANLQTNLQTANGNISSLKTKVEAVPGQITSAVSSVESKIPTEIGAVNLLKNSKSFTGSNITGVSTLLNETYQGCAVRYFKNTNPNSNLQDYAQYLGCVVPKSEGEYTVSFWAKGSGTTRVFFYNGLSVGNFVTSQGVSGNPVDGRATFTLSEKWERYWVKYKLQATTEQQTVAKNLLFRHDNNSVEDEIWLAGVQLEEGNVVSGYEPAPEDTAEQISSLSSEIKQTADGMTLLATKTELNSAKTDLQSGINTAANKANAAQNTANSAQNTANSAQNKANSNAQTISTHTTQISALNTGLQAKVSQTEFNTLSGRVTTAENNIVAKANELSSKITSVEGKIPTSMGGRNYLRGTSDKYKTYTSSNYVLGYANSGGTWDDMLNPLRGKTVTIRAYIKNDTNFPVRIQLWTNTGGILGNTVAPHSEGWSVKTGKMTADWTSANVAFVQAGNGANNGGTIQAKEAKLEIGNIPSDWSPAPEDTVEQISNLSSEIKQTADGMTLLATKTELNNAKTELQSGINTATNKANNAQNKANNNAQIISTHTTQISALNTGLQAKVSQTDFNTLSGRVTTAENNITAKANELSSKITSVEGKIPTEMGSSNLLRKTAINTENLKLFGKSNSTISVVTKDGHQTYKIVVSANGSGAHFDGNSQYYNLIKDRTYTFSFWVLTNKDKPYSFNSLGHIQAVNQNGDIVGSDRLHQHTAPVYSTNTIKANTWTKVWCTFKATSNSYFTPYFWYLNSGDEIYIYDMMLNEGNIPLSYTPAYEDTASQISSLSSELTQTKDGITLLATKTELNTAKSDLQSGINTATNKANAAQNTANNNAQTINTHTTQISALNTGLQAKVSQTDFNTLSGRVTTAENNITAKANELSSKITSVEGKIPSGEMNLVEYGRPANGYSPYAGAEYTTHGFYYNSAFKMYIIRNTTTSEKVFGMNRFKVERNTEYTLYFKGFNNGNITHMDVWFLKRVNGSSSYYDSAQQLVAGRKLSVSRAEDISVTFNTGNYDEGFIRFDNNGTTTAGNEAALYFGDVSVKKGKSNNGWSPSLAELASSQDLKSAQSEIKQTKDGMTLLATKTELSTAKNELQSGINTATNKANSAQSTANSAQNKANSNAQTISTHTTQISALNTGLQAKVSQSEFNTLSGRVTSAENNITAKANELSSKITSVEGKIPTEIGSTNLLRKTAVNTENLKLFGKENATVSVVEKDRHQVYKLVVSGSNNAGAYFNGNNDYYNLVKDRNYTFSFWVLTNKDKNFNMNSLGHIQAVNNNSDKVGNDQYHQHTQPIYSTNVVRANTWTKVWCTFKATSNSFFRPYFWYLTAGDEIYIYDMMLNEGKVPLSYTPAPEDTISQISSLSSELKQTKDGITLLATKTELNTAKNELQSGINTATNKANAAQNTANSAQNTANSAQNKANSNAQTISTHTTQISALNTGLSAKVSQSDFNTLSGRVTTAENNITAKANELSSKISSVEGKLPSGETNLVEYGRPANGYSPYAGAEYTTHGFYYNGAFKMYIIRNKTTSEKVFGMNRFKVERNTDYTLYFKGFNNWDTTNMDVWFLKRVNGSKNDWDTAQILVGGRKLSASRAEEISVTFNTGNYDEGFLRFDNNGIATAGTQADLYFGDVSVKKGRSNNGWSPSQAELASSQDLKNAQSEFKQTTDSIKASVSSLDKSTIKSSSLTINSDGIVMKAGKSTTDVANAIGSYFAVNQNAINLFSDKIKVKGDMIVNGTITGDKIKASSVDVSKIVGIDANFIKSKIEHAMIDWLKGKTITAYNDNMTIDLQNGRISFKDGSNAVYRQTPDGIHTGFLHFDAGSLGGIYAAFGATSTREGINSRSSAFAGIRCYRVSKNGASHEAKIDKVEIVGDTVQFGHGYSSDGSIAMGGGFIIDTAAFANETPYSLNRVVKSIESLWRILHDHARNTGYRFNDQAFINALNDEYNAWHELHNM